MKIYKIKLELVPVYIYPFQFLNGWRNMILYEIEAYKIKKHFKKLAWKKDQVISMTIHCGSLNDAINHLSGRLFSSYGKDTRRFYPIASQLISDGFNRDWN